MPFIGEIRMWAGNFAPEGWAFCDGAVLQASENPALYSLIGGAYGGNGHTTFALPDLRGRAPVHRGQAPGSSINWAQGMAYGFDSVTLNPEHMPAHSHSVRCSSGAGTQNSPIGGYNADEGHPDFKLFSPTSDADMGDTTVAGLSNPQPIPLVQPSLAVSFIIALEGEYPRRS